MTSSFLPPAGFPSVGGDVFGNIGGTPFPGSFTPGGTSSFPVFGGGGSSNSVGDYLNLGANILGGLGGFGGGSQGFDFNELLEGAQEVADYINSQSDQNIDATRDILNDITYGVTGQSPAEEYTALLNYPGRFYDEGILRSYGATARYPGVQATPETAKSFAGFDYANQVKDIKGISQEGFSPLYREDVMKLSTDPPVKAIDPSVYDDQIAKYMDAAELSKTYDYSGKQTQGFLNPAPAEFRRDAMLDKYGSEDTRKQFMSFSSY